MFYSQLLLSKKGALGIVWLAAHCHRRLKKDQVQQTDISFSVDRILDDEVPVVTHRILAFLLLGVVRIYSKKVEYLFEDCHKILNKLCGLKTVEDKQAGIGHSQTCYYSITLPKRFELDAFDLNLEDQDLVGGKVRSHERDMHADGRGKACNTSGLCLMEKMPFSEVYFTAHTPTKDVFSSYHVDQDSFVGSSQNMNILFSSMEILCGTRFCLEDCVDPIALDEVEDSQLHEKLSNEDITTSIPEPTNDMVSDSVVSLPNISKRDLAPSLERLRATMFSLEDRLGPLIMDELETEEMRKIPSDDNINPRFCGPVQEPLFSFAADISPRGNNLASLGALHKNNSPFQYSSNFKMSDAAEKQQGDNEPSDKQHEVIVDEENLEIWSKFQDEPPGGLIGSANKPQPKCLKKLKSLEVVTLENMKCQRREEFPMIVDVSPEPKLPEIGLGDPEVATVQTPATKECSKILKKRKILFDGTTVVSNNIFRSWLDDPTDLKRPKKDSPHPPLHAWRAHKMSFIPESILEPSIPVISADLCDLEHRRSYFAAIKLVGLSVDQDESVKSPVAHVDCEQVGHPVRSLEQPLLAPRTPVTYLKSVRSHEAGEIADSNILKTSSSEGVEKCPFPSITLETDFDFREETSSCEGESKVKGTNSARPRMMGSYLTNKLLITRKHKEEQVLNLLELLAGKTKKESARLFYELLVLKTRGCIDVEQENAYGDILMRETCKLKQA